jgi:hypothetical protein
MPDESPLPPEMEAALEGLGEALGSLPGHGLTIMEGFAQAEARRAERLSAAEPLLIREVGADDPQVGDLRRERDASLKFAHGVGATLERVKRWPRPAVGQVAVFGRVVNATGAPVAGAVVQLSGPTAQSPRQVGQARSNEQGDFALLIGVCEVEVPKGQTADWRVVVVGPKGETLAAQPVSLDPSGERLTFVLLRLDGGATRGAAGS